MEVTPSLPTKFGKFNVIRSNDPSVKRHGAFILIYGASGNGKTTLAASSPGRKVFLDLDRRTDVLSNRTDIDIIYMNTHADIVDFFRQDPSQNWDVIVLDNASELAQIHLIYMEKTINSKEPRQHYSAVQAEMVALLKSCREYAHRTGCCIIWNAWEDKLDVLLNGVVAERTAPAFAPQLAKQVIGLTPIVGYLSNSYTGGINERTLVFESDKMPVKFGVAPNDVANKIPRQIKNPSFDPILRTLIGGEPYSS